MTTEKQRDAYYKKFFGIGLQEYESLLEKQTGRCGCCGSHHSKFNKRLSVDHNHTTGEIRGLLCFGCNRLLIGRHTDPDVLQRAADYLRGPYSGHFVPDEFLAGRRRKRKKRKKK